MQRLLTTIGFLLLVAPLVAPTADARPTPKTEICVPPTPLQPSGPGDVPRPLVTGTYLFRIDGRHTIVVDPKRAARLRDVKPGRHLVALLIRGRQVASIRVTLKRGKTLCVRPDNYDGPQIQYCQASCKR